MEKYALEEFSEVNEGDQFLIEAHDFDEKGAALAPGERCRVTIGKPGRARIMFFADRHLAGCIIDFLDEVKKRAA